MQPEIESLWAQLLGYVDEGLVVPIVGPGLLALSDGEGETSYYSYLAVRLAQRIGVSPVDNLPRGNELNEVACRHLAKGGRLDDLYSQLFMISRDVPPHIPEPLLQLASIRPFRLFVTTTFDSLLERALNQVRSGGSAEAQVLSYSLTKVQDLKGSGADGERRIVYHLFGKLAPIPDFAITHEDGVWGRDSAGVGSGERETRGEPRFSPEARQPSLDPLDSKDF